MSFNLIKNSVIAPVFSSTTVDTTGAATNATTGQAIALSTAGSSGTGAQTSGTGGWPYASLGWDMAGFDGCLVLANITYWTTGPAGGVNTLQIYGGNAINATTALSTTFTILPDAYVTGNSCASQPIVLAVDVAKPKNRFLQAQVQLASSSGTVTSINVLKYGARKEATAQPSSGLAGPTGAPGASVSFAGVYTTVSPGTSG